METVVGKPTKDSKLEIVIVPSLNPSIPQSFNPLILQSLNSSIPPYFNI
jgi:hypothetical protein